MTFQKLLCTYAVCAFAWHVAAADLAEPITLSSENGVLNVLMIAKPAPITTLPGSPTGWVYQICKRTANVDVCPVQADSAPNYYGGTLLRLQRGDHLKIHLVNQLPPVQDSEHAAEPGHEFLALNPTNLHTHGMLVAPRAPSPANPTYGDNIFVLTFNPANGKPVESLHMHSAVRYGYTDYDIKVPDTHPSGLFWFHPHAHGLSLNQVTAGMAGIITVGEITDYACADSACSAGPANVPFTAMHMLLKDTQILPNGQLQDQEDPQFCPPTAATPNDNRQGGCDGQNTESDGGPDYTNGKWYFTVNGQRYPTVRVKSAGGEIWRIANTSASATYDLRLWNPGQKREMLMQVLSIDGVSVSPTGSSSKADLQKITGGKFVPEPCAAAGSSADVDEAVCTRRLLMMPSARAEIWVSYRDASDNVTSPPPGAYAVFRTKGFQTGPSGDYWPAIDLARVEFQSAAPTVKTVKVKGDALQMLMPLALSESMRAENESALHDDTCKPLPPGHMRRIFFSVPTTDLNAFGLAYEEIDEHGNVVGPEATDVTPFDPMKPTVCVPLGPGNTPVVERWQLVNVATEDHNFHMHQVRFRVVSKDELEGTTTPKGVVLDNVPLPHATGTCGNNPPDDNSNPIADWRAGVCQATPITVEIPFAIAGDFVYHCHILEHEDGGMMAVIRVRASR